MSSSVRRRIGCLLEDQIDQGLADEEQRRGARDECEADDRDRGAGEYSGHLALARASDEDDAENRQQDWGDLTGEERENAVGVHLGRPGIRRRQTRQNAIRQVADYNVSESAYRLGSYP